MLEVDDRFKLIFNDLSKCLVGDDSVHAVKDNVYMLLHSVIDLIFAAKDIAEECSAEDDLYELKVYSGRICSFIYYLNELVKDDFIILCFYKSMSVTLCNVMLHITNILKKSNYNTETIIRGFCSFSEYIDKRFNDKISEITANGNSIYDYSGKMKETFQSICDLTSLQIKICNNSYGAVNSYLLFSYLLNIGNKCTDEQLCRIKGTIDDNLGILLIFSEEQTDLNKKLDYKVIYTLVNSLLINCKDGELRDCLRTLKHNINCLTDI